MRTLGWGPCFHGKVKQFKVGAISSFQTVQAKYFSKSRTARPDIKSIQNAPKDLLGQAGKGVGIFKFL